MVATEQLTVGNLTSFLLYAAYVGISIGGLSTFYTELNKGIGAATRLWDIIDREPTIPSIGMLWIWQFSKPVHFFKGLWGSVRLSRLLKMKHADTQ